MPQYTKAQYAKVAAFKGVPELTPNILARLDAVGLIDKYKHYEPILVSNFYQLLKEFETTLTQTIRNILIQKGLDKSSDLVKSVDIGYQQNMFQILANDYYQAVSNGRRPRARKIPVQDLINWIKEKKISYRGDINSAAFAIQQAIYRNGIKGKLYQEQVIGFSTTLLSEIEAEYITSWGLWGLLTEVYHFTGNEFIKIDVKFVSYDRNAKIIPGSGRELAIEFR